MRKLSSIFWLTYWCKYESIFLFKENYIDPHFTGQVLKQASQKAQDDADEEIGDNPWIKKLSTFDIAIELFKFGRTFRSYVICLSYNIILFYAC